MSSEIPDIRNFIGKQVRNVSSREINGKYEIDFYDHVFLVDGRDFGTTFVHGEFYLLTNNPRVDYVGKSKYK